MIDLRNSKGITLMMLIITVIVLLIIAGVGIGAGIKSLSSVNDSKAIAELEMVQHAILEQYTKYKVTQDLSYLVGTKLNQDEVKEMAIQMGIQLVNIPIEYINRDYYKLDKTSLEKISINKASDEYIVNYISGEVINITKKKTADGTNLYIKSNSFVTK